MNPTSTQTAATDALNMIEKWHEDEARFREATKAIRDHITYLEEESQARLHTIEIMAQIEHDATLGDAQATIPLLTDLEDQLIDQNTGKPVSLIVANPNGQVWNVSGITLTDDAFIAKEIIVE